ncbi:hypothetical protein [Komagataeibacter melaceti]|nr:hypothetical protein [Komagataeibacter melaceti]
MESGTALSMLPPGLRTVPAGGGWRILSPCVRNHDRSVVALAATMEF